MTSPAKYPDRPFHLGLINDALTEALDERVAIVQGDRRITYGELGRRSRQLAHLLHGRGYGCHGDHDAMQPWEMCQDAMAICMLNRSAYPEAMLGAFKSRVVPFNVNYRYTPTEVRQLLEDSRAKIVVYEDRFEPLIHEAAQDLPDIELLLNVDRDYEALIAEQPTTPLELDYSPDDIYIIYTGGTTGMPKGVMWPQEKLFLLTLAGKLPGEPRPQTISEIVDAAVGGGIVAMVCAPLMHGAGQWGTLISLHQGSKVLYSPNPDHLDAHAILAMCEREGAINLQITGDAFAIPIVKALKERPYDLSSLFVISSTAVALTERVRAELHELLPNVMIIESYGSTEGALQAMRSGGASDDNAESSTFESANQGVIVDETKTRLLDPSEVGVIGWLSRSGPQPRGYLNAPEKTKETFIELDGERYVVTGDRGHYLADGTIKLLGRDAVCINTGGEKVFAEEVEAALKSHPSVVDALVLGTPDERFGERVTAVISVSGDVTDDELDAHARKTLAGYKVPRMIVRVGTVPRMDNGKPDYVRGKQLALEETKV
jgi:acyl-CoA synthetase (AMP-forming)/AMP-acid ligase II